MRDPKPTYHVIQHVDGNAGFCAILTYTLNGIRMAVRDGAIPVVYYGKKATKFFYEAERGDNVWEYYFEPVAETSYDDLQAGLASGAIEPSQVHAFTKRQICDWHHSDLDRVATFWAQDVPEDPAAWMAEKRSLGRSLVSAFFRVKPHVLELVDAFWRAEMEPIFTIGVHIRGTDFAYAEPTDPFAYFEAIDRYLEKRAGEPYRIFLATDQTQFVDLFRKRYGDHLLTTPCLRSNRRRPPFKFSTHSAYLRGEEVLIDVLLLSRSNYLFKGAAAVGEFALYFSPELECHDFALESRFDPRDFKQLVPAYRKLDIPQWAPPWYSPRRWRRELEDLGRSVRRRLGRSKAR